MHVYKITLSIYFLPITVTIELAFPHYFLDLFMFLSNALGIHNMHVNNMYIKYII